MFIVIKKRLLLVIAAVLLVVALGSVSLIVIESSAATAKRNRKIPVYSVETQEKVVALTFDAAWGADKTRAIVDILKENQARSTFFLVGFWIEKYVNEVVYIHQNGMEIGNHSNNHLHMSRLNAEQIAKELATVNERIKEITDTVPRFFRAPFGEYSDSLINIAESLNMQVIQWDVDSLDWKGLSAEEIKERVMSRVRNGSIVLFHNNSDNIVAALPGIIGELQQQGYNMVTLSEMVFQNNFRIDNSGRQHRI